MKSEFLLAFNQICSERGLPPEIVMDALRTALVSAYRRNTNVSAVQNITAEIDPKSGQAVILVEKQVVEQVQDPETEISLQAAQKIDEQAQLGDTLMVENTPRDFGRIAAQTAKQVILQRIREAERELLYEDYSGRAGEIINGVVQSITPQAVSLNLGRTEALLPRREQVPGETFSLHQRVRAYVLEVRRSGRGPQIIVSRSHKNMLRRLLELEVPEIYNGAVEIKAIAREAGARSKVAVAARQPGVDPVGSCVGMRGVRIQSIVNELGGEKIDVIEWDPDPLTFIAKALSPARVLTVHLEEVVTDGHTATVIVPDDQLSLAIGREGQNARLAAKLTGWRIDIKSVTEAAREAITTAAQPEFQEELGHLVEYIPRVTALLDHYEETHEPYNTEQLLLLRQIIDAVHNRLVARRRAEMALRLDQEKARESVMAAEAARRQAERQQALARIPSQAYETPLEALELSTRVYNHLKNAQIANLGQIMERMVDGDEGLLAIDGIGPKALAEIKEHVAASPVAQLAVEKEPVPATEKEARPGVEEEVAPAVEEEALPAAEEEARPVVEEEALPAAEEEALPAVEEEVGPEAVPEEAPAPAVEPVAAPTWSEIPADAYDIPLMVLALDSSVQRSLRQAKVENLGQLMEYLLRGDAALLAIEGIDTRALAEIKAQVEIMVSVPVRETSEEQVTPEREPLGIPRYEYVPDEELEQKTKPKRRRKKPRQVVYDEDLEDLASLRGRRRGHDFEDWD